MATATASVPVERVVTLVLTEAEASALANVCYRVGGSPLGPRGAMDRILTALSSVGVKLDQTITAGVLRFL